MNPFCNSHNFICKAHEVISPGSIALCVSLATAEQKQPLTTTRRAFMYINGLSVKSSVGGTPPPYTCFHEIRFFFVNFTTEFVSSDSLPPLFSEGQRCRVSRGEAAALSTRSSTCVGVRSR